MANPSLVFAGTPLRLGVGAQASPWHGRLAVGGGLLQLRGSGDEQRRQLGTSKAPVLAAGAFAIGLLIAVNRRRGRALYAAADVDSSRGASAQSPHKPSLHTGTIAAAAIVCFLVATGFGASPAEAADAIQPLPLDGLSWDTFVNLNANVIIGIDSVVGSAGLAIFIYTVIAKLVTFPVYQGALRTNALMRIISPQVKQIQRQYADNEQAKQRMVGALYEKVGCNPQLGLLITLAQLPVFLALFYAVKKLALADAHFKEPFLWIPSLAGPVESGNPSLDWLIKSKTGAFIFEPQVGWLDAGRYLILPIVLIATQLSLAKLVSAQKEPDPLTLTFPFLVGISTLVSPQGVGIYWFTNSVLTAVQTQQARSKVNEEFPEYSEVWEATPDQLDEIKKGSKVIFAGKEGVVTYGPDSDNDCKVTFEDGKVSDYVKVSALRTPGELDQSLQQLESEVGSARPGAPIPTAAASRKAARAAKEREKLRKKRARARA
mmetsp:Transcript_38860/g.77086  ORF Transcript_38860/g.77086 Transcript_38860/m.77086 type:complete len:489 (-) Transcript_38860:93-1559(-)